MGACLRSGYRSVKISRTMEFVENLKVKVKEKLSILQMNSTFSYKQKFQSVAVDIEPGLRIFMFLLI